MSQPPNQPYSGQPHPGQSQPGPPYPGQPQPGQGYPGQPQSGQPYSGQAYPGQPPGGEQPWSSPPGSGQPYPGQPGYPGQPYPGQPNPDVPASVPPQPGYPPQPAYGPPSYPPPDYTQVDYNQPEYAQSGYQQPGYPQPGYPQPGPMPGFPPPKKKSRALPITLVSIALVLVLCVGGGTAVYLAGRNTAEGIADVISSAAPTTQPPRPTEPATPTATISIVEPKTLGGRPKVTDPAFADRVEQLESSLALVPGATQTVGALYGTPAKQDIVVVVAAKTLVPNPKKELDSAFTGRGVSELKLTGVASIPAGPLGGVAKCAKGNAGGAPLAMCGWADEGSSGLVFWYFTSLSDAKKEFIKLRGQVEKKSN
ncbi:hypothetical protein ACQP2Y_38755 [Actinoplanes sp. CA-051413]|uniref:hypothetical protein n=1 Tax=Actinoplanes sp. CA-051413 TaxID=3239899 RepID=UPI003D986FA5